MRNVTNYYFILFLLLASFLIQSCKKNVSIDDSKVITVNLKVTDSPLIDTMLFKSRKVIELETDSTSLIGTISRIIAYENKLFIFDKPRQRVLIFDNSGKFISCIYHIGLGPGEYTQITDICFDSELKQFIFLCSTPHKLIYYDLNGRLISEKKLDELFLQIKVDKNYIYLLKSPSFNNDDTNYSVYLMDKKTQNTEPIMLANKEISQNTVNGNEFVSGKSILFSRRFDNHIYRLKNGKVSLLYKIDFDKYDYSRTLKEKKYGVVEFENICKQNNLVYTTINTFETKDFLLLKTNRPSFYVLSKQTKLLKEYNACFDSKYSIGTTDFYPVEDTSDKIACIYYSTFFENYKKVLTEKKIEPISKENYDLANRLNIDSNPVLFIYQLK